MAPKTRNLSLVVVLASLVCLPALAGSFSVRELTEASAWIFRGKCVAARQTTVDFRGRPLVATEYFFEVSEYLKGNGRPTFGFRQAGTPQRGTTDIGRVGGLTVFDPGREYIVFLRPISKAGLTSAAGRGHGVMLVDGNLVRQAASDGRFAEAGAQAISWEALRAAVHESLARKR